MNVEAFTRLRAIMAAVDPNLINMEVWIGGSGCGTTACAVGHASMDPWFRESGLTIEKRPMGDSTIIFFSYPQFNGERYMPAVEAFFDIDDGTAKCLFGEEAYDNSNDGATIQGEILERIDMVLAGISILGLHYGDNNDEED